MQLQQHFISIHEFSIEAMKGTKISPWPNHGLVSSLSWTMNLDPLKASPSIKNRIAPKTNQSSIQFNLIP